jgi:TRAP-type C4-dicarboxylate transport system permease large subunit
MGIAVIALAVYIALIIVMVAVLKRSVGEALGVSFVVLCAFGGGDSAGLFASGMAEAFSEPIVYAAMTFVFLGAIFVRTGLIDRMVGILNSFLGRITGGAGYVSTVAAALFGAVSHGGSGNAAAVGAVTIPWMNRSHWPRHMSATIVAGNAGMGTVIPPSPSLLILAGSAAVAPVVGLEELLIPGLVAAGYMLLYRLILVAVFVRRHGVEKVDRADLLGVGESVRQGWWSLLVFVGVALPVVVTIGPLAQRAIDWIGESAHDTIDIVVWIPALMSVAAIALGWKKLPHSASGWFTMFRDSGPRFSAVGATVVFAFAASEVLTELGLGPQLGELLSGFQAAPLLTVALVGILVILVAGPLPSAATIATIGGVAFSVLTAAGVPPVAAVTAILIFSSTEGASPPGAAPIYIASGISQVDPVRTFLPLVSCYVIPMYALGIAVGMSWLPIVF